jgi:hypothetical protein
MTENIPKQNNQTKYTCSFCPTDITKCGYTCELCNIPMCLKCCTSGISKFDKTCCLKIVCTKCGLSGRPEVKKFKCTICGDFYCEDCIGLFKDGMLDNKTFCTKCLDKKCEICGNKPGYVYEKLHECTHCSTMFCDLCAPLDSMNRPCQNCFECSKPFCVNCLFSCEACESIYCTKCSTNETCDGNIHPCLPINKNYIDELKSNISKVPIEDYLREFVLFTEHLALRYRRYIMENENWIIGRKKHTKKSLKKQETADECYVIKLQKFKTRKMNGTLRKPQKI